MFFLTYIKGVFQKRSELLKGEWYSSKYSSLCRNIIHIERKRGRKKNERKEPKKKAGKEQRLRALHHHSLRCIHVAHCQPVSRYLDIWTRRRHDNAAMFKWINRTGVPIPAACHNDRRSLRNAVGGPSVVRRPLSPPPHSRRAEGGGRWGGGR